MQKLILVTFDFLTTAVRRIASAINEQRVATILILLTIFAVWYRLRH